MGFPYHVHQRLRADSNKDTGAAGKSYTVTISCGTADGQRGQSTEAQQ